MEGTAGTGIDAGSILNTIKCQTRDKPLYKLRSPQDIIWNAIKGWFDEK